MNAAIHLAENYKDNLFTNRNTHFEALKTLFDITQKLILNQKHEIRHVSSIQWQFIPWMRSTLLHGKVIKLSKAKVHVFSDSVLGRMHRHPDATVKWKDQLRFSVCPILTENYMESMENHLSLSEIFPRRRYIWNSPPDSDKNDSS